VNRFLALLTNNEGFVYFFNATERELVSGLHDSHAFIAEYYNLDLHYCNQWRVRLTKTGLELDLEDDELIDFDVAGLMEYIKNDMVNDFGGLEAFNMAAVKSNSWLLKFITAPSENVQMAAVRESGLSIQFIQNPSKSVQLAAVKQNGCVIQFLKEPSEAVQLAAVKQNGFSVQFLREPSEAVQLAAVKQNPFAITLLSTPSEDLKLKAVKINGSIVGLMDKPSTEIQLAAVKQNVKHLKYIDNPSSEILDFVKAGGGIDGAASSRNEVEPIRTT